MASYTVKQIADILGTNPETVRRWIRDNKLKAVQASRKSGNVVAESELERFIHSTPKYLSKLTKDASVPSLVGIGLLMGGALTYAMINLLKEKLGDDSKEAAAFENSLHQNINKLDEAIRQKQTLIQQTQAEIEDMRKQIEQFNSLLENKDLLLESTTTSISTDEEDNEK